MELILRYVVLGLCLWQANCDSNDSGRNDRPVIGVLAQEYYGGIKPNSSVIAASYVKFLEAAGARVVPVLILFPGGSQYFQESSNGYGQAGRIIFKLATETNNRGDYYPLWGTCLGFELLSYLAAGNKFWLKACDAEDLPLPLEPTADYAGSRLFQKMPSDVKSYLVNLPVTINYHGQCLTPENFTLSGLNKYFKVLSTNRDRRNVTFLSTIEAFSYPYYGVAWHPEKNNFEFARIKGNLNTPHSYEAVRVAQHFANFFVNEARKSNHRFPDEKTESKMLVYNYKPIFTAPRKSKFEQEYFFPLK